MRNLIFILIVLIKGPLFTQNIWQALSFPDTLTPITINAQKEGILIVSAGGTGLAYNGTFKSYDEGETWNEIYLDSTTTSLESRTIQYTNDGILFVGTFEGIYRSYDDGESFEQVYFESYGGNKLMISSYNDIYTVGWNDILRSQDLGETWDTICDMTSTTIYYDMAFGDPGELFAVGIGYCFSHAGFYRSLDDGQTWENIGITDNSLHSIAINESGTLIAGGFSANYVFKSYDKGETWLPCSNIYADVMESFDSNSLIAGGNVNSNTGVWFSDDWGDTWSAMIDEIINPKIRTITISPNSTVYMLTDENPAYNNRLFKSINPIVSYERIEKKPKAEIYPNPCKSYLQLIIDQSHSFDKYIVINQFGNVVLKNNTSVKRLDVSELEPGIYILVLISNSEQVRLKFEKI